MLTIDLLKETFHPKYLLHIGFLITCLMARYVREGGVTIGDIYIPPPPAPACTLDATGGDGSVPTPPNDLFCLTQALV